jgi:hypothetical protein
MARQELPREDLMREATALVQRIALRNRQGEEVVIGFRRDGSGSIYVNQDPAWHFNCRGALRRAYEGGWLIKAEAQRLIRMKRQREPDRVVLLSEPMGAAEQAEWIEAVARRCAALLAQWNEGLWFVAQKVPEDASVELAAKQFLEQLSHGFNIAWGPSVRDV